MHQTRQQTITEIPIKRKGTKYVARALSHSSFSVPVVIAIRDMLKLARNAKEVKEIIKRGLIKINGKKVCDLREPIKLFNILELDKTYRLSILPTRKFYFEEYDASKGRLCKVINKQIVKGGKKVFGLHDGSNIISNEEININDSVYLDLNGKMLKHVMMEENKNVFVIGGKYLGLSGMIEKIKDKRAKIKLNNGDEAEIEISRIVVL